MDAGKTPRFSSNPARETSYDRWLGHVTEPTPRAILVGLAIAMLLVVVTRLPVARTSPLEWDEFEFIGQTAVYWFPMHHTLFMTFGRLAGLVAQTPYQGFIWLDMIMSAAALIAAWWWLCNRSAGRRGGSRSGARSRPCVLELRRHGRKLYGHRAGRLDASGHRLSRLLAKSGMAAALRGGWRWHLATVTARTWEPYGSLCLR